MLLVKRVSPCQLCRQAPPRLPTVALIGNSRSYRTTRNISDGGHRGDSFVMSAIVEESSQDVAETSVDADSGETFKLACPICQVTEFSLTSAPTERGSLECPRCSRSFAYNDAYVDLTLTSGVEQKVYKEKTFGGTSTFQNPFVSLVYERGWRQSFARAGFPGEAKEFEYAMEYLSPVAGEVMMDLSCGSGLFTRRFASSKAFSGIFAVDYSESMLKQTQRNLQRDNSASSGTPIVGVRADVARMPFASGSVAGVHAAAAIHCWGNPTAAMAEISRILKPGGVFVASTFMTYTAPLGEIFGEDTVRPLTRIVQQNDSTSTIMKAWEEQELRDLANLVGLKDFKCRRTNRFIMFSATKPEMGEGGGESLTKRMLVLGEGG
ncbi:hypothetical protein BSKO_13784 [Bryopsis sp. KO-2023]|nr:hypothetical protein BSKO_13784 [Bryopsis sp. KO-2023]